jgi:hypothetical protein
VTQGRYSVWKQGCQIFLGITYQKGGNVPNAREIYQMVTK